MVEIPEHLLQRSREARARLTGQDAPEPSAAAEDEAEPAEEAAAPPPAAEAAPEPVSEPAVPEPVSAGVAATPEPEPEPRSEPGAEELLPLPAGAYLEPKAVLAPLPVALDERPFVDLAFSPEPDSAARRAIVSAAMWLGLGALLSTISGLQLVSPGLLEGSPLAYGRLAPAAGAALLYGWLSLAAMAAMFFVTPRVSGAPLAAERFANFGIWSLQAGTLTGVLSILAGFNTGNPGLEMPWWAAVPIGFGFLSAAVSVAGTAMRRTESVVYVSLLSFAGAAVLGTLTWAAGYAPGLSGLNRTILSTFVSHNMAGLWVGSAAMGAVFFVVPRLTGNPLYSHRLAVGSALSLIFLHPFSYGAHLIYGPTPDWVETFGVAFSVMLVIPALGAAVTIVGSLRRRWHALVESTALKFAVAGAALLVIGYIVNGLQSLRSVNAVVGFTSFTEGTSTLLRLGAFSMFLFAFAYHALPRFSGRQWLSETASAAHFWLAGIGVGLTTVALWAGGVAEGLVWVGGTITTERTNSGEGFQAAAAATEPFLAAAAAGLAIYLVGQAVFVCHLLASLSGVRTLRPERPVPVPEEEAETLALEVAPAEASGEDVDSAEDVAADEPASEPVPAGVP